MRTYITFLLPFVLTLSGCGEAGERFREGFGAEGASAVATARTQQAQAELMQIELQQKQMELQKKQRQLEIDRMLREQRIQEAQYQQQIGEAPSQQLKDFDPEWIPRSLLKKSYPATLLGGMEAYEDEDHLAAFTIWYPLAEQGDDAAQFMIGTAYLTGKGVSKDDRLARKWFLRSAEQGNPGAQYNIGYLYILGLGGPEQIFKGWAWAEKAAEGGILNAQYAIGVNYAHNQYFPEFHKTGYMWLVVAASRGHEGAAIERDKIGGHLTAEDRTNAHIEAQKILNRQGGTQWKNSISSGHPIEQSPSSVNPATRSIYQKPKSDITP